MGSLVQGVAGPLRVLMDSAPGAELFERAEYRRFDGERHVFSVGLSAPAQERCGPGEVEFGGHVLRGLVRVRAGDRDWVTRWYVDVRPDGASALDEVLGP